MNRVVSFIRTAIAIGEGVAALALGIFGASQPSWTVLVSLTTGGVLAMLKLNQRA